MVQELVSRLPCDLVPFLNWQLWTDSYVDLCMTLVANPSHAHFSDFANTLGAIRRMPDLLNDLWVHAV